MDWNTIRASSGKVILTPAFYTVPFLIIVPYPSFKIHSFAALCCWDCASCTAPYSAAASSGLYFNVELSSRGIKHCIIFPPDGIGNYAGVYAVQIDSLRTVNGQPDDAGEDGQFCP